MKWKDSTKIPQTISVIILKRIIRGGEIKQRARRTRSGEGGREGKGNTMSSVFLEETNLMKKMGSAEDGPPLSSHQELPKNRGQRKWCGE